MARITLLHRRGDGLGSRPMIRFDWRGAKTVRICVSLSVFSSCVPKFSWEHRMGGISRRVFNGALASAIGWSAVATAWGDGNRETSVVLLLSGVITDGGWSQLAYNGLKELKARHEFKTAYAENISIAQMDQVARGYSDDGFDMIIGPGVEFSSTLLEVATDYPSQHYFVTTFLPQPEVPRNIMFVNLGYFGAAYGAGILADLISEQT